MIISECATIIMKASYRTVAYEECECMSVSANCTSQNVFCHLTREQQICHLGWLLLLLWLATILWMTKDIWHCDLPMLSTSEEYILDKDKEPRIPLHGISASSAHKHCCQPPSAPISNTTCSE